MAESLATATVLEQSAEKSPAESQKVAKKSKIKAFATRQKSKLVTKRITWRAAKAEQKAARVSAKAARSSQKAMQAAAKIAQKSTTQVASQSAARAATETTRMAEKTLKIPHPRTETAKAEPVKTASLNTQKTTEKPVKLKPQADLPGIISTKTAQQVKQRPMPSSVFAKHTKTKPTRADLINAESRLGSQLFGQIPAGHRREFFHDKKNIWIWHEDWVDEAEHERQMTIRYEVRTSGVYKKVAAGKYFRLEGAELENFRKATHAYLYVIKKYLYNHPYSKVVA